MLQLTTTIGMLKHRSHRLSCDLVLSLYTMFQVYVCLVIVSETSLTWITGVISSFHLSEGHQFYVTCCFYALNAFLGVSALVCFCLLRPDARAVWWQLCRRSVPVTHRTQYPPGGTGGTSKTATSRGGLAIDYALVVDCSNGHTQTTQAGDRHSGVPKIFINGNGTNGRGVPSPSGLSSADDDAADDRASPVSWCERGSTSELHYPRIASFQQSWAIDRNNGTGDSEL